MKDLKSRYLTAINYVVPTGESPAQAFERLRTTRPDAFPMPRDAQSFLDACAEVVLAYEAEAAARQTSPVIQVGTFVAWESPHTGESYKGRVQECQDVDGELIVRIKIAGRPGDAIMPAAHCRVLAKKVQP